MTPSNIKEADVSPGCCLANMTIVLIVDELSVIDELRAGVDPWELEIFKVLCLELDL